MAPEGIAAHPDDVVVTVGSQQGLDLVTRIFCDPGDVVVCEAPCCVGALGVFRAYECDVVHVEMDDDGLVPAALREALGALHARGAAAGTAWFLEVNVAPGATDTSLVPLAVEAAGLDLGAVYADLTATAAAGTDLETSWRSQQP